MAKLMDAACRMVVAVFAHCLSIEAIAAPTLRQCAANAIAAAQNASTMFAMAAMLGRHTTQLKMPRPDA